MIFKSSRPPVTIPDVGLAQLLLARAEGRADKPALIDGPTGRVVTYGQWASGVRRVAAGLAQRGFGKGCVLAICSPNLPEYSMAFHGALLAGGTVTTANPLYTADELASQLNDSGARLLVTISPLLDKAREAASRAGIEELLVFGEAAGATPFAALLAEAGPVPEVSIDPREDVAALLYSSGTTGLPKGVMLTHRNVVANTLQSCGAFDTVGGDDVLAGVLPFFHCYGLVVILNMALYNGATVICIPRFELEAFLGLLQKYGVTVAHLVPPIVLALAKHPAVAQYDLSKLELIVSGAAPLGAGVAAACADRLGCTLLQGYGLTETSPVTHVSASRAGISKLGSIGGPVSNTECMVASLVDHRELAANEQGEICIRGPQVMKGYLNRPDATAAMIDADGWLHTGDIGYADADGDFFIVDRVKELIKYKGLQIAPAELEAVLLTHPAVADAAVIPIPDEEAGEVPKALVLLKADATPEELMAFVAQRVAPYKKIRKIEIIDQIPKTASGKILRRVLVDRERGRRAEA